MDNTAVDAIASLATTQALNPILANANAVILPDKHAIKSLELLQQKPDRFRGTYKTNLIGEYLCYLEEFSTADTFIFIDQNEMAANAILDMSNDGIPLWGEHKAMVSLKKTPAYAAVLQFCNTTLDQQAFIDFAEDWQDHVQFYYSTPTLSDAVPFANTLKTLRKLTVKSTSTADQTTNNFAASRSAMEAIEIQDSTGQEPPTGFLFMANPYEGFDQVFFNCQLRAISTDKDVKLKYRIRKLETLQETIAQEFRAKIKSSAQALRIFIGNMAYQEKQNRI